MVAEPLVIEFHEDHRDPVVTRMLAMVESHQGWINLTPGLDVDVPPPPRSLFASLVGARGPEVPLATWAPPAKTDQDPSTVGIQHARGPKVAHRLAELGFPVPESWRTLQDHPKRGLVCAVPPVLDTAGLDGILRWLLLSTGALCAIPRTGEWRALVY